MTALISEANRKAIEVERFFFIHGATGAGRRWEVAIIALSRGPILVHRLIAKEDRKIAAARLMEGGHR